MSNNNVPALTKDNILKLLERQLLADTSSSLIQQAIADEKSGNKADAQVNAKAASVLLERANSVIFYD